MNNKQQTADFLKGLRNVLFYVGHGKYNDYMSLEEVTTLKTKLQIVLEIEKEFEAASSQEEIDDIHKRIEPFLEFSVKDFIDLEITSI